VGAIQRKIVQQGRRNTASRFFYSKIDKSAIAAWGQDLDRILLIFDVCSVIPVGRLLIASNLDGTVNA
jgi:hypothetical protein